MRRGHVAAACCGRAASGGGCVQWARARGPALPAESCTVARLCAADGQMSRGCLRAHDHAIARGGSGLRVLRACPTRRFLFEEVLDEADAVVLEHRLAFLLRGIEVNLGYDGEVVVACLVAEDLPHVPRVLGAFGRLVKHEVAA